MLLHKLLHTLLQTCAEIESARARAASENESERARERGRGRGRERALYVMVLGGVLLRAGNKDISFFVLFRCALVVAK